MSDAGVRFGEGVKVGDLLPIPAPENLGGEAVGRLARVLDGGALLEYEVYVFGTWFCTARVREGGGQSGLHWEVVL